MEAITTFDSTKESLQDLLRDIKDAKMQLPDFQRGWVWDDEHIRSLIASVSLSFPIGAVMMLQTGNTEVRFKPRLVEGVTNQAPPEPERLILDGQQRLTSLYQSLMLGQPVTTRDLRGNEIQRWYYLDINKALSPNGDRDEAIIGVPGDRKVRNFRGEVLADYSTMDLECAAELLPLHIVFDLSALTNWQMAYFQADQAQMHVRLQRWNQLNQSVIQRFQQYQIPVIVLRKETPKEAVCQVFEKVNTGGVSLTVFELLTATYAADDFNLRDDWKERYKKLREYRLLHGIQNDDFLQAVTLLATHARRQAGVSANLPQQEVAGVSCKRKDILKLPLADYQAWANRATKGFTKAARLLFGQKIFEARDLPYRTQLTPLAAIMALLGDRADNEGVKTKLVRWYWCGVLGELYGGAIETRFAKDLPEVLAWIDGGAEPDTIRDANFAPSRLLTLQTRNSAAYKGLSALLLREGGKDFRTGNTIEESIYFDDKVDIHHIFPQVWCAAQKIDRRRYNSIINKTPLDARTNRFIGGNAPSSYVTRLQKNAEMDEPRMDTILRSHLISPEALRADDFDAFFAAREQSLLERIEQAMGKPIARTVVESEQALVPAGFEDEEED